MRDAAVLVFVTTSSSDILPCSVAFCPWCGAILTFLFAWGRPGMYVTGWKLNGLPTFSEPLNEGVSLLLVWLATLAGLYGNAEVGGLKVLGVAFCETESSGPKVP